MPGSLPKLAAAVPALPGTSAAEKSSEAESKGEVTLETIAAKRVAVQKEIAATRAELAKLPEEKSTDAARWLTQETALLERIDAIHAEQQRTWQHAIDLAKEAADIEERTRNLRPPETTFKPPYDLALLDQIYTEREMLDQAETALKRDLANTETLLEEARDMLEEKDRGRRALRESAEKTTGDVAKAQGNLRLSSLESRLAVETVLLREKALKTLKLQQSLLEPKQKLLRPRLIWLRAHLDLAKEVPAAAQAEQRKRGAELDAAIAAARQETETAARAVIVTERRSTSDKASEELETRRADRQTANLALSVLTAQRERLAEVATLAESRRRVLSGELSSKELRALAEENQTALDQVVRERRRAATELYRSRRELQDWQSRLPQAAAEGKPQPWGEARVKRLAAWIKLGEVEVGSLEHLRTLRSRLKEEIGDRVNLFSWRDAKARMGESLAGAWNYEIFSVQDDPVRVKTVLQVLLLVVLGYHVSRWMSALLARTVLHRMGLNTGRRAVWQTLWFYALFLIVLVTAFNLFHVSFMQFSVVSGALAVGIGFGSQNLIGNFISGLILLVERPVSQGDVIEIDGRQVTVERIGVRSTVVRTLENTHMIVPNSLLLEQPVVNWTLSDDVIRKHIRIGVAYDSSTRKVAELLKGILASVENVQKSPAPMINFSDFGESSLLFEIYFWASISESKETENELRHRIAEVFAKEGVVMAFPQRDIHLETTKPLHVVIAQAPAGRDDPKDGEGAKKAGSGF